MNSTSEITEEKEAYQKSLTAEEAYQNTVARRRELEKR